MTTQRKWFGVTEFEYRPVPYSLLTYVRREIEKIRKATNWRGCRDDIENALGRINALEQRLWVKVEE